MCGLEQFLHLSEELSVTLMQAFYVRGRTAIQKFPLLPGCLAFLNKSGDFIKCYLYLVN